MKICDKLMLTIFSIVFSVCMLVVTVAFFGINLPDLVLPGIIAVSCVACIVLIILCGFMAHYEDLQNSVEKSRILVGEPSGIASLSSAKTEMHRFKREHPLVIKIMRICGVKVN